MVRNTGSERRVERIQVDADVKRCGRDRHLIRCEASHFHDLDPEPLRLLAAMRVERTDSDLDEACRKSPLHDPGERRRMAERIALEIVIEIGVSIEMQDVQLPMMLGQARDDRIGDHVVATKEERRFARSRRGRRGFPDAIEIAGGLVEMQIAGVVERNVKTELRP